MRLLEHPQPTLLSLAEMKRPVIRFRVYAFMMVSYSGSLVDDRSPP